MSEQPTAVDVLVVGAGQAGLGTAHHLLRVGVTDVLVVEAAGAVGQVWRDRWESLRLFTPRRFSSLPGMPFPPGPTRTPSRLEMADYLAAYTRRSGLPVRTSAPAVRLGRDGGAFAVRTPDGVVRARHVVVATGANRRPLVPAAAEDLDGSVHQVHSSSYRRPGELPEGPVLVVGGGNSAAQLALELAGRHEVTVAAPTEPRFLPERVLGVSVYWWLLLGGVLNAGASTPVGRFLRARPEAVLGRRLRRAVREGAVRLIASPVVAADGPRVRLADGTELRPRTVLWCTGFAPDTEWVDVPGALAEDGAPRHARGASPVAGLHWMGLPWQTRVNSSLIDGVDRDARRTARRIAAELRVRRAG
ncbi:putative flavoprotein involved in K+ transport [Blastococcus sp. DSM 46786]|uniref:flavin-containing monooxygenase n=1 Tax=Blastococcus sp. DSM 46786 TaxID=1798227 RepID=UPI0008CD4715|nr:NAD(P)-binding domain-containing protein [Blastococcus sp. DSM 46786]SEK94571.1 putative flavoprotein involved in K+ transport [Blastococcus sp. DSM 46786]